MSGRAESVDERKKVVVEFGGIGQRSHSRGIPSIPLYLRG